MEPLHTSAEAWQSLPDTAAVFLLRMSIAGAEPYIARTKHLRSRVARLLAPAEGKRLSLAGRVAAVEWIPVYSDFEARWMHYHLLRREFPASYRRKLRLRTPPVIRVGWSNAFPRATVTRKIGRSGKSTYYGPFRSRKDAEESLHAVLNLFKVRRCWEDLEPSTAHPGCVYGEMKMCDAPCQLKVSAAQYADEVHRFEDFVASGGESGLTQLAAQRERATEALDFERAAAIHAEWQREKSAAQALPEYVRRIDQWDGILLQHGSAENALRLFSAKGGSITAVGEISLGEAKSNGARAIADTLRQAIDSAAAPAPRSTREWGEHLAVLQKWLYRNPATREGELVQADRDGMISSRRLANAALRLLLPKPARAEDHGQDPASGAGEGATHVAD